MTRINDVAKIMYDQMTQIGQQPTTNDIARVLDAAGHLLPDLPEPTECVGTGNPSWFDGWVQQDWGEVELHHFGYASGDNDTSLAPQDARNLAYALLAAADYAERNHHE